MAFGTGHQFGNAEVQQLGVDVSVGIPRQEDVLGFEVAMHDPPLMRGVQRLGDASEDLHHPLRRQRAMLFQVGVEGLPLEQLHHVVLAPVRQLPEGEDVDDVAVIDLIDRARLFYETRDDLLVPGELQVEDLDRGTLADHWVQRAVDRAETTLADLLLDFVFADDFAGLEVSRVNRWSVSLHGLITWAEKPPAGSEDYRVCSATARAHLPEAGPFEALAAARARRIRRFMSDRAVPKRVQGEVAAPTFGVLQRAWASVWVPTLIGITLVWLAPATDAADARGQVAVATENARSTKDAIRQLQLGGNAVDAAVTAALVAGVTSPSSSGVGGGCFINYFDAKTKRTLIIDARETAPREIDAAAFENRPFDWEERGKWVGVPGEVAGLYELHRRFGKRAWKDVVSPAAEAASRGFAVSPHLARSLTWSKDSLLKDPFLKNLWLSAPLKAGSRVTDAKLGATLARIASEGPKALYEGTIAAELVNTTRAAGGALSLEDLAGYAPKERQPLVVEWEGHQVFTMPPPSAGGLMLAQTLGMFGKAELEKLGHNSAAYQHVLAEAFRGAFADRMLFVGDPDHEAVPLAELLDAERLKQRRAMISLGRTHAIPRFAMEEHGTHHLVTADAEGNMVSLTTTVNRAFGAKLAAPQSGIVLNDELDDFTLDKYTKLFGLEQGPNRPRPGARPVSSMTPTIVVKDGQAVLAAGGSGGLAIATNVSQVVTSMLTFGLKPKEVLDAPRFQMPPMGPTILVPQDAPANHVEDLERRGEIVGRVRFTTTAVQLITAEGDRKWAAADPRKFGHAVVRTTSK